jgi:hypothetical protein
MVSIVVVVVVFFPTSFFMAQLVRIGIEKQFHYVRQHIKNYSLNSISSDGAECESIFGASLRSGGK